jgi:ribonuclease VapC
MIVVDSSALIAILLDEPEKQKFEDIIAGGERCVMSAVNAHETACVLRSRLGQPGERRGGRQRGTPNRRTVALEKAQAEASEKVTQALGSCSPVVAGSPQVVLFRSQVVPALFQL